MNLVKMSVAVRITHCALNIFTKHEKCLLILANVTNYVNSSRDISWVIVKPLKLVEMFRLTV